MAVIDEFAARLQFARAAELARSGRLLEAEAVLMTPEERILSPGELDLLARIHLRQGRCGDAALRWNQAHKLSGDAEYLRLLESLEHFSAAIEKSKRRMLWGFVIGAGILTASAIIVSLLLK